MTGSVGSLESPIGRPIPWLKEQLRVLEAEDISARKLENFMRGTPRSYILQRKSRLARSMLW